MQFVFKLFVGCCLLLGTGDIYANQLGHKAFVVEPDQINFSYQSNVEPWELFSCKHEKSTVGLHEWDVYCKVEAKVHRYSVHLVLSYYTKTIYGGSAYELLYWVTDWSFGRPASNSTTMWFHQKELDSKATVIEAAQGVENDLSSLRLVIKVKS